MYNDHYNWLFSYGGRAPRSALRTVRLVLHRLLFGCHAEPRHSETPDACSRATRAWRLPGVHGASACGGQLTSTRGVSRAWDPEVTLDGVRRRFAPLARRRCVQHHGCEAPVAGGGSRWLTGRLLGVLGLRHDRPRLRRRRAAAREPGHPAGDGDHRRDLAHFPSRPARARQAGARAYHARLYVRATAPRARPRAPSCRTGQVSLHKHYGMATGYLGVKVYLQRPTSG